MEGWVVWCHYLHLFDFNTCGIFIIIFDSWLSIQDPLNESRRKNLVTKPDDSKSGAVPTEAKATGDVK